MISTSRPCEETGAVLVPGLSNLRASRAWAAAGGAIVSDRLFRSDSPARLGSEGFAALRSLGIDLVIDLRSEAEAAAESYAVTGVDRVALPIELLDPASATAGLTLESLYERLVDHHGTTLTAAVRTIAGHNGGNVLVHCTAGKDRTGVVMALTLLALGVDRQDVVADYAATHENLRGTWTDDFLARAGLGELPPHLLQVLNGSPATVLDTTLDRIESIYGGAVEYLRAHDLSDTELAALRTRFVTTASDITQGTS